LVSGQEFVADLESRLEADRGLLAGEHHLGDADRLAALIGLGERARPALGLVDLLESVFHRRGERRGLAARRTRPRAGGCLVGLGERGVALEDLGAERQDPIDAHRAAADTVDAAHAEALALPKSMLSPCSRALARR
ncbi:hypothetical protein QU38_02660, partial [Staphylococcus aureus]